MKRIGTEEHVVHLISYYNLDGGWGVTGSDIHPRLV